MERRRKKWNHFVDELWTRWHFTGLSFYFWWSIFKLVVLLKRKQVHFIHFFHILYFTWYVNPLIILLSVLCSSEHWFSMCFVWGKFFLNRKKRLITLQYRHYLLFTKPNETFVRKYLTIILSQLSETIDKLSPFAHRCVIDVQQSTVNWKSSFEPLSLTIPTAEHSSSKSKEYIYLSPMS